MKHLNFEINREGSTCLLRGSESIGKHSEKKMIGAVDLVLLGSESIGKSTQKIKKINYRERLISFYSAVNVSKLDNVDTIVSDYAARGGVKKKTKLASVDTIFTDYAVPVAG